ncbi:hypothetical protein [Abyssisolibacter fermentans]|uniref:hypothetical protein n=1 Tax=Abyssisolibacter fermentans TaxID=1766203 RepID=UPI0012E38E50|nr:hypothetical protein [Abyssisolibacter fermentans]
MHLIFKNEAFETYNLVPLFYNYFSTYIPFIISIYVTTYILKYIKKNTDVIERVEVTLDVYKIVIMVYMFHYCINTGSSSISEIAQSLGYCTGFIYFYNEIKYQRYYQKSYIHGCKNYFSSAYIYEKV